MDKYDVLHSKILRKLNGEQVESSNEVVSAIDVRDAIYEAMSLYNIVLTQNAETLKNSINRRNGYRKLSFGKKRYPKISKIENLVDIDSNAYVRIYFETGDKIIFTGSSELCNIYTTTLDATDTIDLVNADKDIYKIYLGCLNEFAQNYPGVEMNFNIEAINVHDQVIDDGFLSCVVKMNNPENTQTTFSLYTDHETANEDSKKYSELHDYIAFYNEEFLHKIAINTSDLNPFVKQCVEQYLSHKDDIPFTLSK